MSAAGPRVRLSLRAAQGSVFTCERRFRVLVAGRRFGKTQLALVELLRAASARDRTVWYVAPSYRQAKRIAWNRLKQLTRPWWGRGPQETDLSVGLRWGSSIALRGADNYDALRGDGLDFVVLDEYASMNPACWTEVLRPALSDRRGGALFLGTPQGFNHFYQLYERAQASADWMAFQFTTAEGGNVSREELEQAARELDERCWRQEFQASFENLSEGRAYYAFERSQNVSECRYRPDYPLVWSLDFNVNPMCSIVAQKIDDNVQVIAELALAHSNTPAACGAFLRWTEQLRQTRLLEVQVYGDASGDRRNTAASQTDWQIVRDLLGNRRGVLQPSFYKRSANPAVKDRVNCVNAMLCNYAGEARLQVDPRCRNLIRDLEQVGWSADRHGNAQPELDKSDSQRTHASDALGYYLTAAFPMGSSCGYQREALL